MVKLSVRTEGTRAVVTWNGATLDGQITGLQQTLLDLLQQGLVDFVLELAPDDASCIDSKGLGQFVWAFIEVKRRGGQFRVVGLTGRTKELLSHVRLDE
jgi:anti-anti-sigma regulatory factor